MTKQEYNSSIDSDKSNHTSSVDLRNSISLLNIDNVKNQTKYVIQQKHNANIDSDKSIAIDSTYLVDAISSSNIQNEPIINKNTKENV